MEKTSDKEEIEALIAQIKQDYSELKECQYKPIQLLIIESIRPKCEEVLNKLSRVNYVHVAVKFKMIKDIQTAIEEKAHQIIANQSEETESGTSDRFQQLKQTLQCQPTLPVSPQIDRVCMQDQKMKIESIRVIKSIALQEIKSCNLKLRPSQLQQMLERMENNAEVVKFVQALLVEQGNNLDKVQQQIKSVYENAEKTNEELNQAQREQFKLVNGIRKVFHNTAYNLWGIISWPFKLLNIFHS